jgi:glycosyltransferase involved in cell wall biosynthesis
MKREDFYPKVSIVIPVYNGSNFLGEAIDSALAQTYGNIEVIVVNDGSDDEGATEKIAQSYRDKIRYYRKENGGVASALNFGIGKMKGSYFSWLSHDDLYENTKVEDQINFLNSYNADNIIVASNVRVLFSSGIKKKEYLDKKTFEYFDIFLATSASVGVNGCSLLIPKKALVENNGFNPNLPVTQDYDLWFRLKDRYKFVLLGKPLVISRRHELQGSVLKHELMVEAGDKLHSGFLNNISYERFEKYFSDDKANIKHTWDNYCLYKTRGYTKTASMILKNILRYYYGNDIKRFYKVFRSELDTIEESNKKLSDLDRRRIVQEYDKLIKDNKKIPIITAQVLHKNSRSETRIRKMTRRYIKSVKQDGVYLTGEKIIRKAHSKLSKRGH